MNKFKLYFTAALMAALLAAAYTRALAGAPAVGDVIYILRTGTASIPLKPLVGGTYASVNVSATNGFIQTSGSALVVNVAPALSGTTAIAAASGTNALPAGLLGLSSSNTLSISTGTGQGFRNAP
jgi:hypothetical protein